MNEYRVNVAIIFLGIMGVLSLVFMGICAVVGHDIPPAISAVLGTCLGSMVGMLTPQQLSRSP